MDLEVIPVYVRCGTFSKGHTREEQDPEQCRFRDEYLMRVPDGEWLLVLDADETIGGALDWIPSVLNMMNIIDLDYALISEIRIDLNLLLRPRLIKKRPGLSYVSDIMKHDVIWDAVHQRNYIDIEAKERSMILDFLYFAHYKHGAGFAIYADDELLQDGRQSINLKKLQDYYMSHTTGLHGPKELIPKEAFQ